MAYAKEANMFLDVNKKDRFGNYPVIYGIKNKNFELVHMLIDYANEHNVILKIACDDMIIIDIIHDIYFIDKNITNIFKLLTIYTKKYDILCDIGCFYDEYKYELLINMIKDNDIKFIKFLKKYNIVLKLYQRCSYCNDCSDDTPILYAIKNNNIEMIRLLIDYALENNISLEINEYNHNKDTPLLAACSNNTIEIVKLLIDYANENNIKININQTNCNGNNPIYYALKENNIVILELLIDYADKNNIILKCFEGDRTGNNLSNVILYSAIKENSIELVRMLIAYTHKNNITLVLSNRTYNHKGDLFINYSILKFLSFDHIDMINLLMTMNNSSVTTILLLKALQENNTEMTKFLINYAKENNIIFEINKIYVNYSLFLLACFSNITEIIKYFVKYTKEHNTDLNVNLKDSFSNNALLYATYNNNSAMVRLLMEYAKENKIILEINHKNKKRNYPLLNAVNCNNIEMVKLILVYAKENHIILEMNYPNKKGNYPLLNA